MRERLRTVSLQRPVLFDTAAPLVNPRGPMRLTSLSSHLLASTSVFAMAASLLGCPAPEPTLVDANIPDVYIRAASTLYGPCEIDAQCPGVGAVCRPAQDGYPMGYCTVPCDDRQPCEDEFGAQNHLCVQLPGQTRSYCERSCVNGLDCRDDSYSCFDADSSTGVRGVCLPVCRTDAQCGAGAVCLQDSGRCAPAGTVAEGEPTAAPCNTNAMCASGFCIPEVGRSGTPTSYTQGYCTAYCVLPAGFNTNTFYAGSELPVDGSCAGDSICMPLNGSVARRDVGLCHDGCYEDEDCRDQHYFCDHTWGFQRQTNFDNGVCMPRDCRTAACPSGHRCVNVQLQNGSTSGRCAPM